jgi:hypothetical protein
MSRLAQQLPHWLCAPAAPDASTSLRKSFSLEQSFLVRHNPWNPGSQWLDLSHGFA